MPQLREVRLVGRDKEPARIRFIGGGNVVTGVSDTGKSYILQCIDFVLGAEKPPKTIDEAIGYQTALVEFEGDAQRFLTLGRSLAGGDVTVHRSHIDAPTEKREIVQWRRYGKSSLTDVSSVFLEFADMPEALLRSSREGKTARLTLRNVAPIFLINENSIIAERSPVFNESGYEQTACKRAFAYLLSGFDDSGIIAGEKQEIVQAGARAKLALIETLLEPLDGRIQKAAQTPIDEDDSTIEHVNAAIDHMSALLTEDSQERLRLHQERRETLSALQKSEGQLVAIEEMLIRYRLLDSRYESDLRRLDFVAEGAHFFEALQEVRCPLCDQPMDAEHRHRFDTNEGTSDAYLAARVEASKIQGLRADLAQATATLTFMLAERQNDKGSAEAKLERLDAKIATELGPVLQDMKSRLDVLIQRRLNLESGKSDEEQARALRLVKSRLEMDLRKPSSTKSWAGLEPSAVHEFCQTVEVVLREWSWKGHGRTEFDEGEKVFDIKVDGKRRQSHGKGVRAILLAAFVTGLLRYCRSTGKPHPGFVVLDSPLTTLKQGQAHSGDVPLDPGIEAAFWRSIATLAHDIQVIVLENKEPPAGLFSPERYTHFAGKAAQGAERPGFIPE